MATVAELKSQINSLEQKINLLQPALKQAETTLAQAEKALKDFQSQPADVTLNDLTRARTALDADPTNAELKQQYQAVQAKWDARQAIYRPLLSARDAAFSAATAARLPIVQLESQIGEIEIAIASINPTEASPDAVAALQEQPPPPVDGTSQVVSTSTVKTTTSGGVEKETSTPRAATTSTVTNPSASDAASAEKMANPQNIVGGDTLEEVQVTATRIPADAKASANPANVAPAFAKFKNGDKRVRLIVPPSYLIGPAAGPPPGKTTGQGVLQLNGGIVFPYLPQINIEYSSNWTENQALHSNYKQYFFKTSSPGEIGLVAKFSVQNSFDAATLLAIQHLLRALIKMPFGSDPNAGSPPPICRLLAHGDYMLDGVPVAIKNFKLDYPSDVDYFTLDKDLGYGVTSVPVVTSLSLTLIPVYSRNEMLNASTTGWLIGGQRIQGYL